MHYNQTVKNLRHRENLETSQKKRAISHPKVSCHIIISEFRSRNISSQPEWDDVVKVLKGK